MATRPIHPNQRLKKRRRATKIANGTANITDAVESREQGKEPGLAHGSGPMGRHEQAALTVSGDLIDSPPARSGRRLRFNASLQAKLAKDTEFSVSVFSPDKNRGQVVIESIHVGVYRKGESLFDGDVPVGDDGNVDPGTRRVLSFSDAQRKQLSRVLKSKTLAFVNAVYTAPEQTEVAFSIANQDSKKKKPKS